MLIVILPNALPPIVVQAALMVGSAILFEAGLSFLGLSDPQRGELGARSSARTGPTSWMRAGRSRSPVSLIFITVLAISLVGDGLNDALNPKLRER